MGPGSTNLPITSTNLPNTQKSDKISEKKAIQPPLQRHLSDGVTPKSCLNVRAKYAWSLNP